MDPESIRALVLMPLTIISESLDSPTNLYSRFEEFVVELGLSLNASSVCPATEDETSLKYYLYQTLLCYQTVE